jgi:hypothetical protein
MNAPSTVSHDECMLEAEGGLQRVKSAGEVLFAVGAVASLSSEPRPRLIGDMQWLEGRELLIFTAYGDGPADVHCLRFDEALLNERGSIIFMCGGHVAGTIQCIEDSDVDDPDDYRIAWQLWQEVAPIYQPLIQRCYEVVQVTRDC